MLTLTHITKVAGVQDSLKKTRESLNGKIFLNKL